MKKRAILTGFLLAMLAMTAFIGTATAAPASVVPTTISGTIANIKAITDSETSVVTVRVKVLDSNNKLITVHVSLETAVSLNLVTLDAVTSLPVVNETMIGQEITIDPALVIEDDSDVNEDDPEDTGGENKVAGLLASFFDLDYETVFGFHEEGFGYGTISQALWMANKLGDITLAEQILAAKVSGDYSAFTLPGDTVPTNWGQFRKAVLGHAGKSNLGQIVSGKAEPLAGNEEVNSETTLSNNDQPTLSLNSVPGNQGKKGNTQNPGKAPKTKKH